MKSMFKILLIDSVKREIYLKFFNCLYVKDIFIFFDESWEVYREWKRVNIFDEYLNFE